jgi:two-component system cell cycle sensor histidine kinase/response regulator CckA
MQPRIKIHWILLGILLLVVLAGGLAVGRRRASVKIAAIKEAESAAQVETTTREVVAAVVGSAVLALFIALSMGRSIAAPLQRFIAGYRCTEDERAAFFTASVDLLCLCGADGSLLRVNPAFEKVLGWNTEEILARPLFGLVHPDDRTACAEGMQLVGASRSAPNFQIRLLCKDGSYRWTDWTASVLDEAGRCYCCGRDITEQRLAAEELRESEQKFRQLADNITDAFWIASPDLTIMHYISAGYEQIWGRSRESLYAHPSEWVEAILSEERERAFAVFASLMENESQVSVEYRIARPDGSIRWVHARGFQIRDPEGKLVRIAGIATDVTQRKEMEARLFQSQKMETVGKLAGGIAHEFNSIMTAIIGQSELILGGLPLGNSLRHNASEIRKAADRAAMLTRQLLAYGRKQILRPEVLDLNSIMAGMEGVLLHLTGRDVNLRIIPSEGLQTVKADAGQIEQVVMNMATNATDAMPNGGKLTLETANVTLDEEYVSHFPELKAGEYVMLAITDTGAGMSEEVKARIFDPFFTTKGAGGGTGLGLATCHGILKQSDGHINVYSELGRGATFKIYLPQFGTPAVRPAPHPNGPNMPRGNETILLVEDDPALREMAAALLGQLGYTVLTAANGIEALRLANEKGMGHLDLLFTDVVMPHMGGKELSDRVRSLFPKTSVLFTSAYTEHAIVHQGVLDEGVELLQKPFTPSAMALKIRELLDRGTS